MKPMLRFSSMNFLRASCSDAEREYMRPTVSSSQTVDFVFLYFTSHFYFHSVLFLYFIFLEQLGLGLISHIVTSVTKQITRLKRI